MKFASNNPFAAHADDDDDYDTPYPYDSKPAFLSTFAELGAPPQRKRAFIKTLATTVAHPRKTRRARTQRKLEAHEQAERERIANIRDFLESGRCGPRPVAVR